MFTDNSNRGLGKGQGYKTKKVLSGLLFLGTQVIEGLFHWRCKLFLELRGINPQKFFVECAGRLRLCDTVTMFLYRSSSASRLFLPAAVI